MKIKAVDFYYFGCVSKSGHYMHAADLCPLSHSLNQKRFPEEIWPFIDGSFSPQSHRQNSYALSFVQGWTIFAWNDTAVDKRPGSNSAFLALGSYTAREMLEAADLLLPEITARLRRDSNFARCLFEPPKVKPNDGIIDALAEFLVEDQAQKGICIQLERKGERVGKMAIEWAKLRTAFRIIGYPTLDEVKETLRKIL